MRPYYRSIPRLMSDSFNSWSAPQNTNMNNDNNGYRFSGGGSYDHNMEQLETQWNRSDTSSPEGRPRFFTANWDEYDSYRCGTPDLDELKLAIDDAKEHRKQTRKEQKIHLDGIGSLLCQLRGEVMSEEMERIEISEEILDGMRTRPKSKAKCLPHSDPDEIRRLVRSKIPRCKVCRSRFGERNLLERHLREYHHLEYLEYIAQQEEEIQLQTLEEQSGGFIPSENELASASFDIDLNSIPLPGENTNGITPLFDRNGMLRQSPQCNFCDEIFPKEVSLRKHLMENHPESIEFVQCLDCFKCLSRKEDLSNHHCDLTFMCYKCLPMRNLCNGVRLLLHRANCHQGPNSDFLCNLCNLTFPTPRFLRVHKKIDHDLTEYACHFCNELFTSEESVITHERMHTGIDEYVCQYCDFRCNRFLEMDKHKIKEHGDLLFSFHEYFSESEIKSDTLKESDGFLTSDSESDTSIIEIP